MSIQDVFYLLGSIYLGLGILVSVAVIILVVYIARVIANLKQRVEDNLHSIKDTVENVGEAAYEVTENPFAITGRMGRVLIRLLGYGVGRIFG